MKEVQCVGLTLFPSLAGKFDYLCFHESFYVHLQ